MLSLVIVLLMVGLPLLTVLVRVGAVVLGITTGVLAAPVVFLVVLHRSSRARRQRAAVAQRRDVGGRV